MVGESKIIERLVAEASLVRAVILRPKQRPSKLHDNMGQGPC